MQTKCPIFLIYVSMAVLLALCTVALFAVGYPLSRYECRSWKESVRPTPAVNGIKGKASFDLGCPSVRCQPPDELLRGRGPPEQIVSGDLARLAKSHVCEHQETTTPYATICS